jgi:creatinine amidohydrolase
MGACRWDELTGPEIKAALASRPTEVGLLPVGATEQHGPHLPTGTDTVVATKLADAVSARTGAPVLPPVDVGCSFGHGRLLAGTVSLTPDLLAAVIRNIADWAACSGLRRILAVNAHMGNAAALGVAGDHLRLERPDLRFGVVHWWEASGAVGAETKLDGDDIHGNRAETALMLALAPESVRLGLMASADDEDRTGGLVFRYTAASLSTNGITGRPSEASVALGERLLSLTVDALCHMVERGRSEEPPLTDHIPNPSCSNPNEPLTARSGAPPC